MTTITVTRPAAVVAPRGALWAAQAASAVLSFFSRASQVRPEDTHRASSARRVEEAASVRRHADSLRELDPRFAADLYAAADRHEQG